MSTNLTAVNGQGLAELIASIKKIPLDSAPFTNQLNTFVLEIERYQLRIVDAIEAQEKEYDRLSDEIQEGEIDNQTLQSEIDDLEERSTRTEGTVASIGKSITSIQASLADEKKAIDLLNKQLRKLRSDRKNPLKVVNSGLKKIFGW